MTEKEIATMDARFGADRKVDKLATRYPHGESYLDIMTRLEPLILELHSYQEPLLIVSHQATLRVLRAYLLRDSSISRDRCPTIDIPQHTVMKITWDAWNFEVQPSPLEARMKSKQWPPPEDEKWTTQDAEAALGQPEPPTGREEWYWLGPDPKRSDGQQNL
jgi:broad specificity phosphatase PhoE